MLVRNETGGGRNSGDGFNCSPLAVYPVYHHHQGHWGVAFVRQSPNVGRTKCIHGTYRTTSTLEQCAVYQHPCAGNVVTHRCLADVVPVWQEGELAANSRMTLQFRSPQCSILEALCFISWNSGGQKQVISCSCIALHQIYLLLTS